MRLIDANALMEQVCLEGDCTQCKTGVNEKVCKWNMFQLKDIIDCLEHAPTIDAMPRWIPCEERLPREKEVVLITNSKGNVRCGQFRGTHGKYWFWKGNTLEMVEAWMPLPEPYGGEREDDDKSCDTCKHYDKWWDDIVCDGCTKAHSNWEKRKR